ncbi:hypothetical protein TVAG_231820 [Trichomonas vaginalis G3]|uniref:Uncharacterized protein n=1 Tax=Trichomonas vaginalis (strain ATCC PRA-98 / G3) TaxID=412133 RepID=A2G759_TRIV3|nr:hypothetical protein TVAGG3_0973610 [Trichomonas vaginalis G3]EAX87015.1 hypothetical protein TVAG_231820 [Trichomonas vaginalis G3]KAI5488758.1 hypothetical protein TVAGG3_0973610 [Trichomonas vaginalis G3]|eukprot:XP_001299945.1 hypothetical protein [Trichomonas vaginalis G3]
MDFRPFIRNYYTNLVFKSYMDSYYEEDAIIMRITPDDEKVGNFTDNKDMVFIDGVTCIEILSAVNTNEVDKTTLVIRGLFSFADHKKYFVQVFKLQKVDKFYKASNDVMTIFTKEEIDSTVHVFKVKARTFKGKSASTSADTSSENLLIDANSPIKEAEDKSPRISNSESSKETPKKSDVKSDQSKSPSPKKGKSNENSVNKSEKPKEALAKTNPTKSPKEKTPSKPKSPETDKNDMKKPNFENWTPTKQAVAI